MTQFSCQNKTCEFFDKKVSFEYAKQCDFQCVKCKLEQFEDSNDSLLNKEEEIHIENLPYVIAYPLKRTLLEKHAWTKINLLKDTFLNYLKYLGLLTSSEFFNSEFKDRSMVLLFKNTLTEPSFGTWNKYIVETLDFLKKNNHQFFCPELRDYYEYVQTGKKRKLYRGEIEYVDADGNQQCSKKELSGIDMLINFRNVYLGHGITLDDVDSRKAWDTYSPIFLELLALMSFSQDYPMFKYEHGETFCLRSSEIQSLETKSRRHGVWIQRQDGAVLDILPFFIIPGELAISKEEKEQILVYESFTGKRIKFFSPEGTEKQTSGKILQRLNLILKDKEDEISSSPEEFTKEHFQSRLKNENLMQLKMLEEEKKIISGTYVHREEIEEKLIEWIETRASIFLIAAEAGSGKTNLLVEIQKQYSELFLDALMIRAGRMEKETLSEQIAYVLNINSSIGLEQYENLAGTQLKPTFILIDGINEVFNAEELWQEILQLSSVFEPGSLKFVVTCRFNKKTDIDRFKVSDEQWQYIYTEEAEYEKDLLKRSFQLSGLKMSEMKQAWESYASFRSENKAHYCPKFRFEEIAEKDRSLYLQISNPLILKIFLELYNGKGWPAKGKKVINIKKDWFDTFSLNEKRLFFLLAEEVLELGRNELLLDDLIKHPDIGTYILADNLNAPYQRLKNNGWISRYFKGNCSYINLTVESFLFFILGLHLKEREPDVSAQEISELLKKDNKIYIEAISNYLTEMAVDDDLSMVSDILDISAEYTDVCSVPLFHYLKLFGVNDSFLKILLTCIRIDSPMPEKILFELKNNELSDLMQLFLNQIFDFYEQGENINMDILIDYFDELSLKQQDLVIRNLVNDEGKSSPKRLIAVSKYFCKKEGYESSRMILDSIVAELRSFDYITQYKIIRERAFSNLKLYTSSDKAIQLNLKYLLKESEDLLIYGIDLLKKTDLHIELSILYEDLGYSFSVRKSYNQALSFYDRALEIRLTLYGEQHSIIADLYNKYGYIERENRNYNLEEEYCLKALKIRERAKGVNHLFTATNYLHYGNILFRKKDFQMSLSYLNKCLAIRIEKLGENHKATVACKKLISKVNENI